MSQGRYGRSSLTTRLEPTDWYWRWLLGAVFSGEIPPPVGEEVRIVVHRLCDPLESVNDEEPTDRHQPFYKSLHGWKPASPRIASSQRGLLRCSDRR